MKRLVLFSSTLLFLASCATNDQNAPEKDSAPAEQVKTVTKEYREQYDSGQLKIEGKMVNDQRQGLWKSYYPDGKKWSETTFDKGVKSGNTTTYFENGMMRYNGQYKNDQKVGVWNLYNPDGTLEKAVNLDESPETEKHIEEHSSR